MHKDDFLKKLQTLSHQFSRLAKQFSESPVVATQASADQWVAIKTYASTRAVEIARISNFYEDHPISEQFYSGDALLRFYKDQSPEKIIELLEANFTFFKNILKRNYSVLIKTFKKYSNSTIKEIFDKQKKEIEFSKTGNHDNFSIPAFWRLKTLKVLETLSSDQTLEFLIRFSPAQIHEWLARCNFKENIEERINVNKTALQESVTKNVALKIFNTLSDALSDILEDVSGLQRKLEILLRTEPLSEEYRKIAASIHDKHIDFCNTSDLTIQSITWYQKKLTAEEREALLSLKNDIKMQTEDEFQPSTLKTLSSDILNLHSELNNHPLKKTIKHMMKVFKNEKKNLYCIFEKAHQYQNFSRFKAYLDMKTQNFSSRTEALVLAAKTLCSINDLVANSDRFFTAKRNELVALQSAEATENKAKTI